MFGRIATAGALVAALIAVGFVVLGGRSSYRVHAVLTDAGQLVGGNLVTVGGATVGKVESIDLTHDNQARVTLRIDDGSLAPLHEGTTATIRSTSLSAVAGRVVALAPGPNNAPKIPDGGTIGAQDTHSIVEIDELLNSLDAQTRSALQGVVHGSAVSYDGHLAAANAGLQALSPALSETVKTTDELLADQGTFERFIVQASAVVGAVAGRRGDLETGIADAAAAADAVASRTQALTDVLTRAPGVLRQSNSTLVDVRSALGDLVPALHEARPVAPRAARLIEQLAPLLPRVAPVVRDVEGLLPDLRGTLTQLPATEKVGRPALAAASAALQSASPIVAAARAYTPDLVAGLLNGFGGTTGSYYDANGHFVRIALMGNPAALQGIGALLRPPAGSPAGVADFRSGVVARCPGAAEQP
ncbi:MAG: phospholipid/cholesterol/gamma-HCH transport system substrate-binding protein, partial [Frankiaceae bacterium]|nr:phospholipid/cholesterol/gamma-HCH transport system substrate-binding protein [Frankiaceae bacterium]